jgi:phosphatidylglycerophosphatase C
MSQQSPVVVFDFDLTLTRWDTADRFFRWLLKREPWRFALVVAALPVLAGAMLLTRSRKRLVWFAVWVATLGRSPASLPKLVDEHIRSFAGGPESVLVPAAVERLRAHLAQGHRVVIATGSLEPLAKALLGHAGLSEVPLAASTVRSFLGGLVRDQHCFGANKVPMLSARGFAPPWAVAYTDHHADLPVLRLSARCYLVSPRPECLVIINQALATETAVLAWR